MICPKEGCSGEMKQHGFEKSQSGKTIQVRYVCSRCKHTEFKRETLDE